MGNAMSWRPPPPHGTVQMVIEPDVCCTCEACCGRQWDESTPKPDFVAMSESRWSEFKTNVGIKVRSYRKENLTAILLAVGTFMGFKGNKGESNDVKTAAYKKAIGAFGVGLIFNLLYCA